MLNKEFLQNRKGFLQNMMRYPMRFFIVIFALCANVGFGQILKSVSTHNVTCNGGNNGWIKLNMATLGPFEFRLNGGSVVTDSLFTNLVALPVGNTYKVEYKETSSTIWSVANVSITEPKQVTISFPGISLNNVTCFNGSDGEVVASASGDYTGFKYQWNTTPVATTAKISGLKFGNYTVTATDDSGCFSTNSVTISQPTDITYTLSMSQISCFGKTDGSVTLKNVSGGTGTIGYTWTGGPSGWTSPGSFDNITGLSAGTYNYEIKDGNGCTKTGSATIIEPSQLAITETVINATCYQLDNGDITIDMKNTGTAPYQYTWSSSTPGWSNPGNKSNNTNIKAGSYTIDVMDSRSCTVSKTITVTEPSEIVNSVVEKDISCNGKDDGSIDITVSGGVAPYSYLWTDAGTYSANTEDISSLKPSTYNLTVTDKNLCQKTYNYVITQPDVLAASTVVTDLKCNSDKTGAIDLKVTGGTSPFTYSWTDAGTFTASTEDLSSLSAGTYAVDVTDANGCKVSVGAIKVKEPDVLALTETITKPLCNGSKDGAIDLTVTGGTAGFTYSWTDAGTYSANTQDISAIAAGDYTVVVTDANSCVANKTITVLEPAKISIIGSVTDVDCNGNATGSIDITPAGGTVITTYVYSWDDFGNSATQDLSNLLAGDYEVTVQDDNGCFEVKKFTVNEPTLLSITETHIDNDCFGDALGSIDVSVSGGVLPASGYTYDWTSLSGFTASSEDITGLAAEIYDLKVTDGNGCNALISVEIKEPTQIQVSGNITDVKCFASNEGEIALSLSGGTIAASKDYVVDWTGPGGFTSSFKDITKLYAGDYNYTITDDKSCQVTGTLTVGEPTDLKSNITSNSVCDGDGTLTFEGVDGTPGAPITYTYEVDDKPAVSPLTGLFDKIYEVKVIDANGCMDSVNVDLKHNDPFKPMVKTKMKVVYLDAAGQASIVPSDIDNGSTDNCGIKSTVLDKTNFTCSDVGQNLVTLTVTDINDNVKTDTASVFVRDTISPTITVQNTVIPIDTSGFAYLTQNLVVVTSSDNCTVGSIVLSKTIFGLADVGNNAVDITITDVNGNVVKKTVNVNVYIADSDKDSIPDYIEKNWDTDGDGAMNYLDLDSDNDAIADLTENNSQKSYTSQDKDADGIPNALDLDSDDDGINDVTEADLTILDTDGDGQKDNSSLLIGAPNDQDLDGTPDYLDLDSDGDGINDLIESLKNHTDANNDGMVDGADLDKDGLKDFADGSNKWPDANDKHPGNSDSDSVEDWRDTDSDNDGITDQIEGNIDTDSDGTANYRDLDSDADGISDQTETAADFDGDGKGNYIDTDSDADGINDQTEGTNDADGDNAGNWLDTDSDGDGINDQTEGTNDADGDGTGNWLDLDSDADGISDQIEGTNDADSDGIGNWLDLDSDADGISDKNETSDDYDGDGTGNWLDLDSDDDEILDTTEGEVDADNNGKRDFVDAQYIIPEGFSPNGDGTNDIFYITGLKVYKESQLVIINQWGQIVFDSGPGYTNNWDGNYGGTGMKFGSGTVPEGIYYFVFKPNKFNLPNVSGNIYIKP